MATEISGHLVAYLLIGAAAGGFVNGLAGFGTALFTLGFWLQVLRPEEAVSMVVIVSVVTGLQGVWVVRRAILAERRRLLRFLLPAFIGIPLGVASLNILDARALKLLIAGFLILYGGFFTIRKSLPRMARPTPVIDSLIGFGGGVMGGAASLSGALPTMWCAMRPWSKDETRAVLQPFNVSVLCLTAALFAIRGSYNREALVLLAMALPVAIGFAQVGIVIFKRIETDHFRRLLITLMLVSGLVLALKEMF